MMIVIMVVMTVIMTSRTIGKLPGACVCFGWSQNPILRKHRLQRLEPPLVVSVALVIGVRCFPCSDGLDQLGAKVLPLELSGVRQ